MLDDTGLFDGSERLDETVDLTPARVRARFSAWHRETDKELSRRRGNVQPRSPAATFTHSRLGRYLISRDIDGVAAILQRLDWLGDVGEGRVVEPRLWLPADPWRTATVPELARLGLLRYRRAGTGIFRDIRCLDSMTAHLKGRAGSLASNLTAGLTSGDFRPGGETSSHEGTPSPVPR